MILDAEIRHGIVASNPLPAGEDLLPRSIQHTGSIYFILQQRIDGVKGLGLPSVLFVGLVPEPEHEIFSVCKVVNEEDFLPLHFFHIILKEAQLVRKYKGNLIATKKGKEAYKDNKNTLFSILYPTLYEQIDISYFDRVLLSGWPNLQIGVVLYCLTMKKDFRSFTFSLS